MSRKESQIEQQLIDKLVDELKYTRREDIHDKAAGAEFPRQVPGLNQVRLTDAEFARLRDDIIGADVFQAARTLREYGYLQREDGTPLHSMLINLEDWCKNHFEVVLSCASVPTTATTATMSSCLSTACRWCRSRSRPWGSARAEPWSRSWTTRTTPATATMQREAVLFDVRRY
jgi:hypothetical protein